MFVADPRLVHQDLDDIRQFPLDDSDVIIAGFPRSGTNWMQVMFANLWDDWSTTANEHKRVPNLTGPSTGPVATGGYEGYAACISCPPPRLMKTHLPRALMPERWPDNGKVVHVTRNPKDVCVSNFYQHQKVSLNMDAFDHVVTDIGEFVDRFCRGEVTYGPYVENVLSWREFDHPNLMKVTYEEVRRDPKDFLLRLRDFLGKPVDVARIDEVVAQTAFDAMRKNDLRHQINIPSLGEDTSAPFMRRGKVGDWRNELTPEMSAKIDREVVRPLEESGVFLDY
jgi:hypothetical protein